MTTCLPVPDANPPETLGARPHLYRPDMWRGADEIGVSRFRQIFTWPLALRLDRSAAGRRAQREALDRSITALMAHDDWEWLKDRLDQDMPQGGGADSMAEAAQTYAEFVYFHDFMQDTLFGEGKQTPDAGEPLSIFANRRITTLDAEMQGAVGEVWRARARVERMQLHLYRTGALILTVEADFDTVLHTLDDTRPMRLSDVQMITDRLRRVYTPFFAPSGDTWPPGLVPQRVVWRDADERAVVDSGALDAERPDAALAGLRKADRTGRRNPPVHPHWAALLSPLRVAGDDAAKRDVPLWRHVVDERVPTMSFVSLHMEGDDSVRDTLRRVSRGDWVRLCYADGPGASPLPYAAEFLKNFEQDTCYDRFMACDSMSDDIGTRFMFAGYHFVQVGAGGFFEGVLQHHFRRHYLQMAKAVHMELASLLATSSRVTDAVCALREAAPGEGARQQFSETLLDIQHDFMDFVHLFRFTGMSNQIQPTEMFRMWRRSLDLETLFEDVGEELRSATGFIYSEDDRRQTDSAAQLNMIAVLGVVLGIGLAFLGANVNFDPEDWASPWGGFDWLLGEPGNLAALGLSLAAPSVVAMVLLRILTTYKGRLYKILTRMMWGLLGLSAVLFLADFGPFLLDELRGGRDG